MLNNAKPKLKNQKNYKIDGKVQRNDRFVTNCQYKVPIVISMTTMGTPRIPPQSSEEVTFPAISLV